jgi:phosphoenolpyruvate carboxykinase (GTP)
MGQAGVVRRDPMAMLPFCGYNMGDYFRHWLAMGKRMQNPPKIFHVNWFRTGPDGKFLWPGYGENLRVLEWILDRAEGEGAAVESPIGYLPRAEDLHLEGLGLPPDRVRDELLSIDRNEWIEEAKSLDKFLSPFGDDLPREIRDEERALLKRLGA